MRPVAEGVEIVVHAAEWPGATDGRIEGDRVLGVRFADTPEADYQWAAKPGMLVLMNTPGLAKLRLRFDQPAQRLTLTLDGVPFVSVTLDAAGRAHLADVLASYTAFKGGHALNNRLLRKLLDDETAYDVVTFDNDQQAPAGLAELAPAW